MKIEKIYFPFSIIFPRHMSPSFCHFFFQFSIFQLIICKYIFCITHNIMNTTDNRKQWKKFLATYSILIIIEDTALVSGNTREATHKIQKKLSTTKFTQAFPFIKREKSQSSANRSLFAVSFAKLYFFPLTKIFWIEEKKHCHFYLKNIRTDIYVLHKCV